MNRRVVVTGMAGITPLGNDWPAIRAALGRYRNAVRRMEDWAHYEGQDC
jgi:3-oxoacyl-[acyl-carrier-protein] synthase II